MEIKPTLRAFVLRKYFHFLIFGMIMLGLVAASYVGRVPDAVSDNTGIFLLLAVVAFIIPILHAKLHEMNTILYISDDGYVIYEYGIVRHEKKKLALKSVTDTSLNFDLVDRLVGTATVKVNTPGSQGYEVEMHDVDGKQADEFHDQLLLRAHAINQGTTKQ